MRHCISTPSRARPQSRRKSRSPLVQASVEAFVDARQAARDLAGHEGFAAPWALVVDQDAVTGIHPVGLAVVHRDQLGVELLLAQKPSARATRRKQQAHASQLHSACRSWSSGDYAEPEGRGFADNRRPTTAFRRGRIATEAGPFTAYLWILYRPHSRRRLHRKNCPNDMPRLLPRVGHSGLTTSRTNEALRQWTHQVRHGGNAGGSRAQPPHNH